VALVVSASDFDNVAHGSYICLLHFAIFSPVQSYIVIPIISVPSMPPFPVQPGVYYSILLIMAS